VPIRLPGVQVAPPFTDEEKATFSSLEPAGK
jgi:hypothetical protein